MSEWQVTRGLIANAPNLPQPQRAAPVPPAPGTSQLAQMSSSSDDPDDPDSPPQPGPAAAAPVAAAPAAATPAKRPRMVDLPERLRTYKKHVLVAIQSNIIGSGRPQKRCRVCYVNGKRKDTTKECRVCKIPLCIKGPCFQHYHTRVRYWTTSPTADVRRGRQTRGRQQQ